MIKNKRKTNQTIRMMRTLRLIASVLTVATIVACGKQDRDFDATGTFEAVETTVCAQQTGELVTWNVEEGSKVQRHAEVGLIDTTQIVLRMRQVAAGKRVVAAQSPDVAKQVAAIEEQLAKARQEYRRYSELVADGAAPRKQMEDAQTQVQVLAKQLVAQRSLLNTQVSTLGARQDEADSQTSLLRHELRKCHVVSPVTGTVLEKYVERGEYVVPGKPLFKVADLETVFLRAYLTSLQLQRVKIGQKVTVMANFGQGERRHYEGTVTWISGKSEFTPKTVLTDDERADLVYAVKVAVKNDGMVKIGMYGEMKIK